MPNGNSVWTSSLLYILTGLGIEEQTARQAIARGAAAGWITGHRHGREVQWELTPAGRRLIDQGAERVYSMSGEAAPWDGNWLILLVSIPQQQRAVRKKLYAALSWEGFGNPTPGVWLSPHPDRQAGVEQVISTLGLRESTLAFVGSSMSIGLGDEEIVRRAWDLDEVTARYEQLLVRFSAMRPEPGDPLLFTHVQLVSEWQRFPFLDPQLPRRAVPGLDRAPRRGGVPAAAGAVVRRRPGALARGGQGDLTGLKVLHLSVITVRFVMAHMVAAAAGKDHESEKVHTLRS